MRLTTALSEYRTPFLRNRLMQVLLFIFLAVWLSTLIGTSNLSNWFLENALVVIFLLFLFFSYKKVQLSDTSYLLITIYLLLHVYGAMYTYALNPFGFWLQDVLQTGRNQYDRIVHFSFGFLLAYPMRDIFKTGLKFPNWVAWVLPVEITISFSCIYELIEWAVADVFFPAQGLDYLGSQGDIWDAQKDMALASLGAVLAMIIAASIKRIFFAKNAL